MKYFAQLCRNNKRILPPLFMGIFCSFLGAIVALMLNSSSTSASETLRSDSIDNLTVKMLTLLDKNNKVRAQLGMQRDGTVTLALFDEYHNQRMLLNANNTESVVDLLGVGNQHRVTLITRNSGYSGIHIKDHKDNIVYSAATSKDRPMLVALTDENKRVRHAMGFDAKRTSYVMTGPSGDEANLIFMESDGSRGFSLTRRRSGGPIAVLGMDGDRPSLVLHDANKSGLAMGYAANGEPGMLINRDGMPIWKAGAGSIRQTTPSIVDLIK